MMMQMFGQMMWLPVSLFARWMDLLTAGMQAMSQPCCQVLEAVNGFAKAPGMGFPERGTYGDNPWAQGDGAIREAKEERKMSDCNCRCDNDHGMVKLVEYTIVSIKRCDERILYKGEIIETEEMSDEAFATWVVAVYLQIEDFDTKRWGPRPSHADKKFLRVYHRVLESWPRQKENCCDDRHVHVLEGIEKAIRGLTQHVGGQPPAATAPL